MASISELVQRLGNAGVTFADAPETHKLNSALNMEDVEGVLADIFLRHLKTYLRKRNFFWCIVLQKVDGAARHYVSAGDGDCEPAKGYGPTEHEAFSNCILHHLGRYNGE